jgi:diacylglycerol kinase family enzyme
VAHPRGPAFLKVDNFSLFLYVFSIGLLASCLKRVERKRKM